jgi:hypothetical protein
VTQQTARWTLWLALLVLAPVPFFLVETGSVPVVRLLMLGGVMIAVVVSEGAQGMVGIAAALLLGQAVAYLCCLWLVAHVLSRFLARGSARRTAACTLLVVALGVALVSAFDLYETPFRTRSLHGNLLDLFE